MTPLQQFARRYRRALHVGLGLAAVGLLLWGRLILKEAPRTATADGPAYAWTQNVVPPDGESGPITAEAPVTGVKPGKLGKNADRGGSRSKSESMGSDDSGQMQAAQTAAAELNLQGVTTGKVPVARIDGRLIRVGDTIQGFTLTACEGQSVTLERAGHVFRLVKQP